MSPSLRLAPTPSGYLHLGNGVNFALNALLAERLGGRLLLRVDDLDAARLRPAYLDDLADTLHWLLPRRADELLRTAVYQSGRRERYRAALALLRDRGLLYACACSRRDIRAAQEAAGLPFDVNAYPGTCRGAARALDQPDVAWRLRPDVGVRGDFVVRQRDGTPAYQLASVVDDVDLGITHVVRGVDLRASSEMQRVLAQALARVAPQYAAFAKTKLIHHPLITDEAGRKLSKSAGSASLRTWREAGRDPGEVFALAARLAPDLATLLR